MKLQVPSLPIPAGGEELLQVLPEVVVPVEKRKGCLAGLPQLVPDLGIREQKEQAADRFAVKGLGECDKLVLDGAVLPVGGKSAIFPGKFLLQLVETGLHLFRRRGAVAVMDGDLEKPPAVKAPLDGLRGGLGEVATAGGYPDDAKCGLIAGQRNVNVQGMCGSPVNQVFRSIAPMEAEGWLEHGLGVQAGDHRSGEDDGQCHTSDEIQHTRSFPFFLSPRKPARSATGSVLVEATIAMSMLSILGLILLKLSLNVTAPRQWTLQQSVTDAYLTFEKATAQRATFEDLSGPDSLWPLNPQVSTSVVELGKLPGGQPINGSVTRTRFADTNNLPLKGGAGTLATNPSAMEVWRLQSVIRYTVGGRTYLKSRTVVRSQ